MCTRVHKEENIMLTRTKKFIGISAATTALVLGGVALLSSNIANNVFRGSTTDTIEWSITFTRSSGSTSKIGNYTFYTKGYTYGGYQIFLRNVTDGNMASATNYVAIMCGSTESPTKTQEISFTIDNSIANPDYFEFQNITSITAYSDSGTTRNLTVSKSDDGSSWTSAGNLPVSSSGGTNTSVAGAKYVKLGYSGFYNVNITSFTVNYSCSPSVN